MSSCANDTDEMLTHLIRALSTACRYLKSSENEVDLLFKLCNWLSPSGLLSENSYFSLSEVKFLTKIESLREFVAAGVVRHLDANPTPENNIMNWIEALGKLEDSFLNEMSFRYYKNLIEVKLCEERLMGYQNKLVRIKMPPAKKNDSCIVSQECVDCSKVNDDSSEQKVEEVNLNSTHDNDENDLQYHDRNCVECSSSTREEINKVETNLKTSDHVQDVNEKFVNIENTREEEKSEESLVPLSVEILEKKVLEDKALLWKLNDEIINFESTKISSPNPVPVFFMLKKMCLSVSESPIAQVLLANLEEKWRRLNSFELPIPC